MNVTLSSLVLEKHIQNSPIFTGFGFLKCHRSYFSKLSSSIFYKYSPIHLTSSKFNHILGSPVTLISLDPVKEYNDLKEPIALFLGNSVGEQTIIKKCTFQDVNEPKSCIVVGINTKLLITECTFSNINTENAAIVEVSTADWSISKNDFNKCASSSAQLILDSFKLGKTTLTSHSMGTGSPAYVCSTGSFFFRSVNISAHESDLLVQIPENTFLLLEDIIAFNCKTEYILKTSLKNVFSISRIVSIDKENKLSMFCITKGIGCATNCLSWQNFPDCSFVENNCNFTFVDCVFNMEPKPSLGVYFVNKTVTQNFVLPRPEYHYIQTPPSKLSSFLIINWKVSLGVGLLFGILLGAAVSAVISPYIAVPKIRKLEPEKI